MFIVLLLKKANKWFYPSQAILFSHSTTTYFLYNITENKVWLNNKDFPISHPGDMGFKTTVTQAQRCYHTLSEMRLFKTVKNNKKTTTI